MICIEYKFLREEKNLKQEDLAKVLDISIQAVSHYELERRDIPTKILIKLANYFDVSIDYLLGNTNISKKENSLYEEIVELFGNNINDFKKLSNNQKQEVVDFICFLVHKN